MSELATTNVAGDTSPATAEIAIPPNGTTAIDALDSRGAAVDASAFNPRRSRRQRLRGVALAPLIFLRYLLRKLLWVVVRLLRAAWARPIVTLLLVIAATVGWQSYSEYVEDDPPPQARPIFDIAPAIPPAPAAMRFLDAQKEYDGELMWNLFAEGTKNRLLSQGISLETFQAQVDDLGASGIAIGDSVYIGGIERAGINLYFYDTAVTLPNGLPFDAHQVFYVDAETGRIIQFDSFILEM